MSDARRAVSRFEATALIERPPAEVYEFLLDPANEAIWRAEAPGTPLRRSREFELVSGVPGQPGARYRYTERSGRLRSARGAVELAELEPERRIVFTRDPDGHALATEYILEPADEGTKLTLAREWKPSGLGGRLLDRRMRGGTGALICESDLARIKHALEEPERHAELLEDEPGPYVGADGIPRVQASVEIARSPHEVFVFLADPANEPLWHSEPEGTPMRRTWQVELVSGPAGRPGSRYRRTVRSGDFDTAEEFELTAVDPDRRVTLAGYPSGNPLTTYELEPLAAGTRVALSIEWKPGRLGRMRARVAAGDRRCDNELRRLRETLEG